MNRNLTLPDVLAVLTQIDQRYRISSRDGYFRALMEDLRESVEPESEDPLMTRGSAVPDPEQESVVLGPETPTTAAVTGLTFSGGESAMLDEAAPAAPELEEAVMTVETSDEPETV